MEHLIIISLRLSAPLASKKYVMSVGGIIHDGEEFWQHLSLYYCMQIAQIHLQDWLRQPSEYVWAFLVSSNPQAFCPSTGGGDSTGHHRFIIHVKQIMPHTLDLNPFRKEQIPDLNVDNCTVSDPLCFLSPTELLSFQHCNSSGNPGSPFISWWWACRWHQSTKPPCTTVLVLHLKAEVYKNRMVHFGGNHYYIIL